MGNRTLCGANMCPKATLQPVSENELFDDTSACDPAGTVFNETLEDLSDVDRLLLFFSSSSNVAAVRWLIALGCNADACDTNGTTCLHTACRSGSLAMVREFIRREIPLDATDTAGWTPLHVALFMGRRSVALELLRAGADLVQRNARGLSPADLCSDVLLREAIHSCAAHRHCHGNSSSWHFGHGEENDDIQISSLLRFEPFFVPRAPIIKGLQKTGVLNRIGVGIFNQRPGQGLAFLVATGAVRDFPVELSSFLSEQPVCLAQIGEYLGEDFSLSQTLRLEYVNSVRLLGTGIVACLSKVFQHLRIPSDMQKIDRLLDGVAQIWWRQHEQIRDKETALKDSPEKESGEVEGLVLMGLLRNHDTLHRLLFSTVMLHWNLYAPLPATQKITLEMWHQMNADIETASGPKGISNPAWENIQRQVHREIGRCFIPQLQIWTARPPAPGSSSGTAFPAAKSGIPEERPAAAPADNDDITVDGWMLLVGGGFPSFAGASGMITYRHIRSILSEATSTTFALATPNVSRQDPEVVRSASGSGITSHAPRGVAFKQGAGRLPGNVPPTVSHAQTSMFPRVSAAIGAGGRQDWVWFSLRDTLLFLSPKPTDWAPYAFVHLRGVAVWTIDRASCVITLGADTTVEKLTPEDAKNRQVVGLRCDGGIAGDGTAFEPDVPLLQLVFLLPDGRWQVLELPCLKVQVPDVSQLDRWTHAFRQHCTFLDTTNRVDGDIATPEETSKV